MARKVSQSDPALAIEFWLSGFYTHRSQLFAPFKGIGVNVIAFHDPVIDGTNMEDSDLYEWTRRPGFSIYCPEALNAAEVADNFYSFRDFDGTVFSLFDSNQRLASFDTSNITSIIAKTGTGEGYISAIGNLMYFADGTGADMQKWEAAEPFSVYNPSSWGIAAPTVTPTIYNRGCWLPKVPFVVNNAILDPNGNVEVVIAIYGVAGLTGSRQPVWPLTTASTINDGSIQWENMGPLVNWLPDTNYPVPIVVLDTNGNLELATTTSTGVTDWNSGSTYNVGNTVFFGGNFWTSVINSNTDIPPTGGYTVTTGGTTQPAWVLSQNPVTTGPTAPTWNKTVGGTTVDGSYTWMNIGPGQQVESFGTSYVYAYRTIYGELSTSSPASVNTGAIFGPVAAAITSFEIIGNVVTFQGVNNFIPGNVFSVQGLSSPVGEVLDNQSFIIISAGLSPTQFSAVFDYPDVAATIDSGSTLNLVATVTGVGSTSPLCNAIASITATQVSANIVTIYANMAGAALIFVPGLFMTFSGVSVATFLNGQQYEIINVDPDGQWFQIYYSAVGGIPDQPLSTDTGTATFNSVEVYRTSDGGGIYLFAGAITNPSGSAVIIPYDSGATNATVGADNGIPGTFVWANPGGITSNISFATVALPTPSGGTGNFTLIQTCKAIANESVTSGIITAAFTNPVTANNQIVVFVTTYDTATATLSDSQGNSYTLVTSQSSSNDHGVVTNSVYLATGVAAGATTVKLQVTFNEAAPGGNSFFGFGAMECAGVSGVVDTYNSVFQTSGTTLNTGSVTTTNAHDVILSFVWSDLITNSGNVATPPGSFASIFNQTVLVPNDASSYQQMSAVYQAQTATGTFSPTWSTPSNSKAIGITVALELTLYSPSDGLQATNYGFAIPPNISITGIQVAITGSFSGTQGSYSVQLLKNGSLVGSPITVIPTGSTQTFTLGGTNNLWGTTWSYFDFNSPGFGVQITANIQSGGTGGTFSAQNATVEVFGNTSTTGWVFNDFTIDDDLDVLLVTPQNHQNDPPPGAPGSSINTAGTILAYWQGRIWMAVGNYVYFDAGSDCTNGVPESAWPPANRFQFVGPVLGLQPTADGVGLLVYLADRVNAILGGPETISFYPTDALSNFGISSPNAIFRDGSIIGQFTTQRQYFEIVGGSKNEVGEHISDYLTANFVAAKTYVTMHRNGLDVGVFMSNGVDRIVRYGTNIGAWSVPAFPIGGAGALRSIETSVGIYTLMLASPVAAVSTQTPASNPTLGASIGSGTAWTNPSNITLGSPTSYAVATFSGAGVSQVLSASEFPFNIPETAIITGIEVSITGKASNPSGGIGAFDTQTTGSGVGAISLGPLTPTTSNEWVLFAGTFQESPAATPYFLPFGGSVVNSFVISGGVITVTGKNNLTPGQIVYTTGCTSTLSIDGMTFTVVTASGSGWTANTILPNGSGSGVNGMATVMGWKNLTNASGYYNTQFFGLWGTLLPSSAAFPPTSPLLDWQGSPSSGWIGNMLYFKTDGAAPVQVNNAHVGNAAPMASFSVTEGNTLLFWGINFTSGGAPAFSDTQGNSYTIVSDITASPSGVPAGSRQVVAVTSASATGTNNLTITWSTSVSWFGLVTELSSITTTPFLVQPLNPVVGAESDQFALGSTNTTVTFGGSNDLWGMPWRLPNQIKNSSFGFGITATAAGAESFSISEVQVTVFYQSPANYLRARDVANWADNVSPFGTYGIGQSYDECFITVGSITLTPLGAPLFPLQHVVGYFDAVGNLGGFGDAQIGPSVPDVWILPNEVAPTSTVNFIQLPEVLQEPPTGQNNPSSSILALRWPVNMMNSNTASQFIHHLQVKIQFDPENAPNTVKALAFKQEQD